MIAKQILRESCLAGTDTPAASHTLELMRRPNLFGHCRQVWDGVFGRQLSWCFKQIEKRALHGRQLLDHFGYQLLCKLVHTIMHTVHWQFLGCDFDLHKVRQLCLLM